MVILPEPASYRDSDYARLRDYVHDGGTLVAVGNSLLHGGRFELEDVFGLTFLGSLPFRSAHFVPAPAVRGACDDIPLQIRGTTYKVALHGATELAALHFPMTEADGLARKEFRSEYSPAQPQRSPYPFATVHRYGKGKAVYVAAGVFSIYWKTNHHWLRQFMEALLRHVDPAMPYEVAAAGTIEANLMRAGDDLLLNLIHYALGHQGGQSAISAIEQVHPVRDIPCRVRCAAGRASRDGARRPGDSVRVCRRRVHCSPCRKSSTCPSPAWSAPGNVQVLAEAMPCGCPGKREQA